MHSVWRGLVGYEEIAFPACKKRVHTTLDVI